MQSFESSSFSLIPLLALFGTCSYPSRKSFLHVARLSLLLLLFFNFPKTRTVRSCCSRSTMRNFQLGRRKKGFGRPFWLLSTVLWRQGKALSTVLQPHSLGRNLELLLQEGYPGGARSDQVRWVVYCSQRLVLSTWPFRTEQPPRRNYRWKKRRG